MVDEKWRESMSALPLRSDSVVPSITERVSCACAFCVSALNSSVARSINMLIAVRIVVLLCCSVFFLTAQRYGFLAMM